MSIAAEKVYHWVAEDVLEDVVAEKVALNPLIRFADPSNSASSPYILKPATQSRVDMDWADPAEQAALQPLCRGRNLKVHSAANPHPALHCVGGDFDF
jgi:hypothetical protein